MELRSFIVFVLVSFGFGVFCQNQQDCCMNELCPYYCVRCDGTSQCFDLSDELGCSAEGDKLLQSYEKPPIFVPFVLKTLKAQLRKEKESVVSLFPNRQCITQQKTKVASVTRTENTYNVVKESNNKTQPVWSLLMKTLNGESVPLQTTKPPTTTTTEIPVWLQLLQKLQAEQQRRSMTTTTTTTAPTTEDWFAILKSMIETVKKDEKTTLATVETKSTSIPQTTIYSETIEESTTTDPSTKFISPVASEVTIPINNLSTPLYIETTTIDFKQTTLTHDTLNSKDKNTDKGANTNKEVVTIEPITIAHNASLLSNDTLNGLEASTALNSINSTVIDRTVHFTKLKSRYHANETTLENSMTESLVPIPLDKVIYGTVSVLSTREDPILEGNNTKRVDSITQVYPGSRNASTMYNIDKTIGETTIKMIRDENVTGIPIKLQNDGAKTEISIKSDAFAQTTADDESPGNTFLTRQQNVSKKNSSTTTASAVQELQNMSKPATRYVGNNVISVLGNPFVEENFTEISNRTEIINSFSLNNKFKLTAMNESLQANNSPTFDKNLLSSFTTQSIVVGEDIDKGNNQNSPVESEGIISSSTDLTTTEAEINSLLNSLRKTLKDTRMLIINATGTDGSMTGLPKMNKSANSQKVLNTSELEMLGQLKHGLLTDFQTGNIFQNDTPIDTRNTNPVKRTTNDNRIEQKTTETAQMIPENTLMKHGNSTFPFEQLSDFKTHQTATDKSTVEATSLKPMPTSYVTTDQPINTTETLVNSVGKLIENTDSLVNEKHANADISKISIKDMPKGENTIQTSAKTVEGVTSDSKYQAIEMAYKNESQLISHMSSSSPATSTRNFRNSEMSRGQMTKNNLNSSGAVQVTSSSLLSTLKESVDFLSISSEINNATEPFRKDEVNTTVQLSELMGANASSLNQYFTTTPSEYDVLLKEVRRALNKTKDRIENIAAQLQIMENPSGKDFSSNYEIRSEAIPTNKDLFKYGLLTDSQSNDVSSNLTLNAITGDKVILNEVSDGNTVTESIKTNLDIAVPDNKPSMMTPPSWSYDTTTFSLSLGNFWDTITTQSSLLDSVWSPMPPNTIWSSLFDTWNFGTFGMPTTSKTKESLQPRFSVTESPKANEILSKSSTTTEPKRALETEPLLANANQIPVVKIQEINRIATTSSKAPSTSSTPYLVVQYDSTTPRSNLSENIGQSPKELATDANKETEKSSIKFIVTTAIEKTTDGKMVSIKPLTNFMSTTQNTPRSLPSTNELTVSEPKAYLEVRNLTTSDKTSLRPSVTENVSLKDRNQFSTTKSQIQIPDLNGKGDNYSDTYNNNAPQTSNSNVDRLLKEVNGAQEIHKSNNDGTENKIHKEISTINNRYNNNAPQTSNSNVDRLLKEVNGAQEIHKSNNDGTKNKIRKGASTINLPTQGSKTLKNNWWDKSFKPTTWFPFDTQYQTSTGRTWRDRRLSSREDTVPATTAANGNGCILLQDASAFCEDLYSGQYKNPDDCTTYFVCDWGDLYRCRCPPNTLFDDKLRVCNWNYAVTC